MFLIKKNFRILLGSGSEILKEDSDPANTVIPDPDTTLEE